MEEYGTTLVGFFKAVTALFVVLFGWVPDIVQVVMLLMTVNIVLGRIVPRVLNLRYNRDDWMLLIMQKCGIAFLIGISWIIESGSGLKIGLLVSGWFLAHEGLSCIGFLREMGVPMPRFLEKRLLSYQREIDPEGGEEKKKGGD